ncbi:MAG: Cation diffusion facilitator family transporter [Chthoniobacteraceae bacterium]|nr:Cation diffusion facilitator family transporter [Chthoniobacteraceae bacterium]
MSAVTASSREIILRRLESGARLALLGVFINSVLAIAKILAGILGNCYALIADGIESALDIFSSLILWFGLKVAAAPPDAEHPYGHGKAEPIAAVIVSLAVIGAAVGLSVQSIREIVTPHHAPAPFTLGVLVLVIIVKETLFRKVIHAGDEIGSTAVKSDAWHHRSDAITSGAAFIGISIALIGGQGWEPADDWAALLACGLIAFNGLRLLQPALHEIMDTAPPKEFEDAVRAVAENVVGVVEVEQCRMRKMGLDFYVDIHVGVQGSLTVYEGHRIAHDVKDTIRASDPSIVDVLVHIEPAETEGGH